MGFNQHVRGVWVNGLCYNVHPVDRQDLRAGQRPAVSLTGQPSACGTAREVGTFAHRLPADLVVAKPEHRVFGKSLATARGHAAWQGRLPRRVAEPHAQGRQAQLLLVTTNNNMQAGRTSMTRCIPGLAQPGQLRRGLDAVPDRVGDGGRPDPADRDVGRERGAFGNAERRTQLWRQQTRRRASRARTCGSSSSSPSASRPRRFGPRNCWPTTPGIVARPVRRAVCERCGRTSIRSSRSPMIVATPTTTMKWNTSVSICKRLYEEYRRFGIEVRRRATTWPSSTPIIKARGLRWPVVE